MIFFDRFRWISKGVPIICIGCTHSTAAYFIDEGPFVRVFLGFFLSESALVATGSNCDTTEREGSHIGRSSSFFVHHIFDLMWISKCGGTGSTSTSSVLLTGLRNLCLFKNVFHCLPLAQGSSCWQRKFHQIPTSRLKFVSWRNILQELERDGMPSLMPCSWHPVLRSIDKFDAMH